MEFILKLIEVGGELGGFVRDTSCGIYTDCDGVYCNGYCPSHSVGILLP